MAEKKRGHKILRNVLIGIVVAVVAVVVAGAVAVRSILYPDALVTGDGDVTVACVGDSITYSQGVVGSRKTEAWPSVLAGLLGDDYQTINYGLCNRTLLSTGNMPYFEEDLAAESLASDAQIVIFMLGSNDTKLTNWDEGLFVEEYGEAIDSYLAMESEPTVYVMIPPRIFLEDPEDDDCNDEVMQRLRELIPQIAAEKGVEVIDLYTLTEDHAEWFDDGLHPNADGNQAIAEYVYEQIAG